jgi:superfamily II helicase
MLYLDKVMKTETKAETRRERIQGLIDRLRKLEEDASRTNLASFAYGEELANRRIKLEKTLLDEDIDEFYDRDDA